MKKYLQVFKVTFQQEFAYRLNFIMWRVRNVIQIFLVFFLWSTIFADPQRVVFGYDRSKILTYVFGILVVKAIVFSSRTIDMAGLISRGELSAYLLKPISFFKFWFTRDISSKLLNFIFAFFETILLFFVLKPTLFLQTNLFYLFAFFISLVIALLLFFCIVFLTNIATFWMPEMGWGFTFLFISIFAEFLSGSIIPLNVFPTLWQNILYSLPFPYLLFFPIQTYLGKMSVVATLNALAISIGWLIVLVMLVSYLWNKGLRRYSAEGI